MTKQAPTTLHELALFDKPPPDLPLDVLLLREQYQALWEMTRSAEHAYFAALATHYNQTDLTAVQVAAGWYRAQIRHLTTMIVERRRDGLDVALHMTELEALYDQAESLGVAREETDAELGTNL